MIFCARRFIQVIAPFVVPVLTETCGFVASIPPKSGTTNTVGSVRQRVKHVRDSDQIEVLKETKKGIALVM